MISGFAERMTNIEIGPNSVPHDILVHASGALAVAEFILREGTESVRSDPTTLVKTIIDRLRRTTTFPNFLTSAARQIRAVTGFDRVMIYKFLADDSGEVVAEAVRAGLPPLMGVALSRKRYPAAGARAVRAPMAQDDPRGRLRADLDRAGADRERNAARPEPLDVAERLADPFAVPAQHGERLDADRVDPARRPAMGPDRLPSRDAAPHLARRRPRRSSSSPRCFPPRSRPSSSMTSSPTSPTPARRTTRLIAEMEPEETIFENLRRFDGPLRELIQADGIGIWTDGRFESCGDRPTDRGRRRARALSQRPGRSTACSTPTS